MCLQPWSWVQIIEDAAVHEQYCRVITPEPAINEESEDVCALLKQCLDMRWVSLPLASNAFHLDTALWL